MSSKRKETTLAITTPDGLIRPTVELIGRDGNAFAILGATTKALRRAGNAPEVIEAYKAQATSGDYDHLLAVTMAFAEVE
jgi:hypothetical protein